MLRFYSRLLSKLEWSGYAMNDHFLVYIVLK